MNFRWDIIFEYAPFLLKGTIAYNWAIGFLYSHRNFFRVTDRFRENNEKQGARISILLLCHGFSWNSAISSDLFNPFWYCALFYWGRRTQSQPESLLYL